MFRPPNNKINPKKSRPILNISDAFRPLGWINGIMGLGMIEMPYGRPWPKLSIIYGFFRATAFSVLVWFVLSNISPNAYVLPIMSIIYKIIAVVSVTAVVFSSVMGLINHKKSKKFFEKIKLADESLKMFGVEPEYSLTLRENRKLIIKHCITVIVTFIITVGIAFNSANMADTQITFRGLYFIIPLIVNPLVDINYISKLYVLGKRFEKLNALIHNVTTLPLKMMYASDFKKYEMLLKNRNIVSVIPNYCFKNRNNMEYLLKVIRQLHLDLCQTARDMNDFTYNEISLQISSIFVYLTISTYSFYFIFNEKTIPLQAKISHYIFLLFFIICSIVRIIIITYTTVKVIDEAGKIGKMLHQIQIRPREKKLINEIHHFCMQLTRHPLSFTACGFVELNFSYVNGFVGSVTTYLMILIQNQRDVIEAANTIIDPLEANSTDTTST